MALAQLLGPDSEIYAVDKNVRALANLRRRLVEAFPRVRLHCIEADFTGPLTLPRLDGIVMANSLHFVRHKEAVVTRLREMVGQGGRLIVVEYNVDRGNIWVPYPLSFSVWQDLARRCGFDSTALFARAPAAFYASFTRR